MSDTRVSPPVTVLVTRRVRRGRAPEFEHLMAGMQAEQGCYRTLCRHRRIADVTHGDAAMRVLSGLETWFALPAARTKLLPAGAAHVPHGCAFAGRLDSSASACPLAVPRFG